MMGTGWKCEKRIRRSRRHRPPRAAEPHQSCRTRRTRAGRQPGGRASPSRWASTTWVPWLPGHLLMLSFADSLLCVSEMLRLWTTVKYRSVCMCTHGAYCQLYITALCGYKAILPRLLSYLSIIICTHPTTNSEGMRISHPRAANSPEVGSGDNAGNAYRTA